MMASELAQAIAKRWRQSPEAPTIADAADVELQEVRECLDECIAAFPETAEGEQRAKAAQRARQLADRLRVG